jgi:hypothetical protein
MVAIIDVDDVSKQLAKRAVRHEREKYTVAWRQASWQGGHSQLALLCDPDGVVRWLGRAVSKSNVTDRDRRIEIVDIEEFEGIQLEQLRLSIPDQIRPRQLTGILPEVIVNSVLAALIAEFPELAETIRRLSSYGGFQLPDGVRGYAVNEQRDGVGLILDFEGIGREPLRECLLTPESPSFLSGMPRTVSEETLLTRDLTRFPGLDEGFSGQADWRVFRKNGRKVFILNSNTEPIEHTFGTDMVYFNETFKSFVLVQYKRAIREVISAGRKQLWYRADDNIDSELERMRLVDEMYGGKPGAFRLFDQACWLKVCEPSADVQDPVELMKGMYLTREHFTEIFENQRGPRGGRRIGYDNVPRYINNTLFVQLVKDAWVGTRGTGTEELGKIVDAVLTSRRAITLGISMSSME